MSLKPPLSPEINIKSVHSNVALILKHYKAWKIQIKNKEERINNGFDPLFPILIDTSKENELRVIQIERALESVLDEIERRIVETKYLGSMVQKDFNVYVDLGLNKDVYYEKKKGALLKIAFSLGVI